MNIGDENYSLNLQSIQARLKDKPIDDWQGIFKWAGANLTGYTYGFSRTPNNVHLVLAGIANAESDAAYQQAFGQAIQYTESLRIVAFTVEVTRMVYWGARASQIEGLEFPGKDQAAGFAFSAGLLTDKIISPIYFINDRFRDAGDRRTKADKKTTKARTILAGAAGLDLSKYDEMVRGQVATFYDVAAEALWDARDMRAKPQSKTDVFIPSEQTILSIAHEAIPTLSDEVLMAAVNMPRPKGPVSKGDPKNLNS